MVEKVVEQVEVPVNIYMVDDIIEKEVVYIQIGNKLLFG